jgi:HTH-type transcriptional regulator / antitoxin HigA
MEYIEQMCGLSRRDDTRAGLVMTKRCSRGWWELMQDMTASTARASEASGMQLRPLRDEADHEWALREVERLWDASAGSAEDDRLQVLVLLIEAYEREHHPIDPPDPANAIRFRMEQSNLTLGDLAALLGVSRRRVLAVLRGAPLTLPMIRLLVERLGVSADVLVRHRAGSAA